MVESTTQHYGWTKPEVTKSASTWGGFLNTDLDSIDALVFANQQGIVPIGSITMFGGATAPANWLICDGSTLDYGATPAYQGLFNVIGRAFNTALTGTQFALPDLRDTFPIGVSATRALAAKGGAATVTLDTTMIPGHGHTASQVAHGHAATQAAHSHVIATGGHSHAIHTGAHAHTYIHVDAGHAGLAQGGASVGAFTDTTSTAGDLGGNTDAVGNLGGSTDALAPAITVPTAQPAITVNPNLGGGGAHNNMPPFITINFLIRYQ